MAYNAEPANAEPGQDGGVKGGDPIDGVKGFLEVVSTSTAAGQVAKTKLTPPDFPVSKTGAAIVDGLGKTLGYVDAGLSIRDAINNPTAGNITKAVLKTGLAFIKINPVVGLVTAVADITGLTDFLFDW